MSKEWRFDPSATQRLRDVGSASGEHHWRNLLGDAIASLGDQIAEVREQVTALRLKQEHQISRYDVAKISNESNQPLRVEMAMIKKLVFGVLIVIVIAVATDAITSVRR